MTVVISKLLSNTIIHSMTVVMW